MVFERREKEQCGTARGVVAIAIKDCEKCGDFDGCWRFEALEVPTFGGQWWGERGNRMAESLLQLPRQRACRPKNESDEDIFGMPAYSKHF